MAESRLDLPSPVPPTTATSAPSAIRSRTPRSAGASCANERRAPAPSPPVGARSGEAPWLAWRAPSPPPSAAGPLSPPPSASQAKSAPRSSIATPSGGSPAPGGSRAQLPPARSVHCAAAIAGSSSASSSSSSRRSETRADTACEIAWGLRTRGAGVRTRGARAEAAAAGGVSGGARAECAEVRCRVQRRWTGRSSPAARERAVPEGCQRARSP